MSIQTAEELAALRRVGRIVALALAEMERRTAAGVTTRDLDDAAARVLAEHGARPTPKRVYGFPGVTCVSVNDEAVHGVPGSRRLRPGDVVKLDVTADCDGFVADAARTVVVGGRDGLGLRLAACARAAFDRGLAAARAGNR